MRTTLVSLLFAACAALLADDPVLVIDSGGHTAAIRKTVFTKDGGQLVSAGEDKVVRVWDVKSGKTVRTIRGEIGTGQEGKIYAIALSPDNRYLAVGGWLVGRKEETRSIRIHDFSTGEIVGVLKGHTNVVFCVAFSPDGRYLASGGADNKLRIWDMKNMSKPIQELSDHKGHVRAVGFSPDGSGLVSASFDHSLILWSFRDGRAKKQRVLWHEDRVLSALFSPDGRTVASSSYDRSIRLWDVQTGRYSVLSPNGGPANLAFHPDGTRLLAMPVTGSSHPTCQVLLTPSGEVARSFREHKTPVTDGAISPDGKLAATAGMETNEIYVWDVMTGTVLQKLVGAGRPIFSAGFAKDGRSIAFGTEKFDRLMRNSSGVLQNVIQLRRRDGEDHIELAGKLADESAYFTAEDRYQNYQLQAGGTGPNNDSTLLQLLKDGVAVQKFPRDETSGYRHLSYAFSHDGRYFASGGSHGVLTLYSVASAKNVQEFSGHTGEVWAVAVSPDNRTLLSGSDDQTLRLWDIATGRNILTIFVTNDGEWVASTPEGYYASSVNGDNYIGWHLNQGEERQAKYFSVAQFQKEFYRPDVVAAQLGLHDIDKAVKLANSKRPETNPEQRALTPADISDRLPPEIQVTSGPEVRDGMLQLKAVVRSSNLPITGVDAFVNGIPIHNGLTLSGGPLEKQLELKFTSLADRNSVYLVARTNKATARGEGAEVKAPAAQTSSVKPNLYVLAVGVASYEAPEKRLKYAAQDAKDLLEALKGQENLMFKHVEGKPLLDQDVTSDNLRASLEWLGNQGTEADFRLLFLAGHGTQRKGSNQYFFLSYNHDFTKESYTRDLPWADLLEPWVHRGRGILMVDTCHAAAAANDLDFNAILKNTTTENLSLVTYAASTGSESSHESDAWRHGAFTKALLDVLSEKPQGDHRVIYTDELGVKIRERTQDLMKGMDEPQDPVSFALPLGLPAYRLFALP